MPSKDAQPKDDAAGPIMARLKTGTREHHARLAALPFFQSLAAHRLPLECYINQLRAMAVILGVLENTLSSSHDVRVSAIWHDGLKKSHLLENDLAFFKPQGIPDSASGLAAAHAMTGKIRLRGLENTVSLLGYLYVMEGSTLGNHMHQPDIAAAFRLDGFDGNRYYTGYGDGVQDHWRRFSKNMNETLADSSLHDSIMAAAHEAFSGLETLYKALYSMDDKDKALHAARINPEAGNHPIPSDEREIQAALKASRRCWTEFPYYEKRYGQRGRRFSDSDTCWLAVLTALNPAALQKQIDWLGRVLAGRGMPTLMLERVLRVLNEELSAAVAEKAEDYDKLRRSADAIKNARERFVSDTALQALSVDFEKAVGSETADAYRNTGQLLVAAVVDEKNGIAGAVQALAGWLTDHERFSDQWVRAVEATIKNTDAMVSQQEA